MTDYAPHKVRLTPELNAIAKAKADEAGVSRDRFLARLLSEQVDSFHVEEFDTFADAYPVVDDVTWEKALRAARTNHTSVSGLIAGLLRGSDA